MTNNFGLPVATSEPQPETTSPLVIATMLRAEGSTGVQTHVQQLRHYLAGLGVATTLVTPFCWGRKLTVPVFGVRLLLRRFSKPANVAWYRYWHEWFLRNALRRSLAGLGACTVYAQCPVAARAALRARQGPHQRVVLAVHFRISQADEWAETKQIRHGGRVFRSIRNLERRVIPQTDGLMYVSRWARDALLDWLPDAAAVPSTVIDNFVEPVQVHRGQEALGDLVTIGHLEPVKNHRFLLQVLAEAHRAGRTLTLDIFGEGPLSRDLLTQARALGVEAQVRFRGYRRDVRDFLPGFRCYVHASYSEACPLALIEAMAAGLPIVAAPIGPTSELYDDGVEGRFWNLGSPAAAAATLLEFLDSEPERARSAAAARERFSRQFDARLVAPRLYSFLLGPHMSRAAAQNVAPLS